MARLRQEPKKRKLTISQVQRHSTSVHKANRENTFPQHVTFPKHLDQSLMALSRSPDGCQHSYECRVVIDLGTARLYLVYSLPGSDRLYEVHDWDGTGTQEYDQPITFTVLYYLTESRKRFWNGRRFLWGREVEHERQLLLLRKEELDPRRLVQFFKPAIHKTKTAHWYDNQLNEQAQAIFGDATSGVKQFALDFMDGLFEHLFHPDRGHIAGKQTEFGFQMKDVVLVFTMPSGWPIPEYEIFQQPAEKWGLRQSQIQYVSESDGAIRYWISKEGWRLGLTKTNSFVINVDIGAGTIDISIKRITSFNESNPKSPSLENALPQRGLDYGIERIIQNFEENMLSRFHDHPPSDAKVMAKCAAQQFRSKWRNFKNGDFFEVPSLRDGFFVTRDELTAPYETAISAVVEVLESIQHDLVKLGYDGPMCILLSGGGTAHSILVDGLKNRFPDIPFHCMPSADLKKGCAKGGFLESLDRTNFTQHKFARASYAIKSTQPCSPPGTRDEELSPEEVRMIQLDPTAEKIKDKLLDGYMFDKEVNDWFAKLHDPLIWKEENFVWREKAIQYQEDLNFYDTLVEFEGHPGSGGFTIYDDERESYKIEFIHVKLSPHVKRINLRRGNRNKREYKTRLLEYCYRLEQDAEDRTIFFVLFRPHGKDEHFERLQVYPTGVLNIGRLEGHRNLEDPSFSSISDSPCSKDSISALSPNQLKSTLEQYNSSTEAQSSSSDTSLSRQNTSSDATSSSLQLQATSTFIYESPQHSLTQLSRRDNSKSGILQNVVEPSFFDDSSTSRPSEVEISTPSTSRGWPLQNTQIDENIKIAQEQPALHRRLKRKVTASSTADRKPLSSIDVNIESRYGTRVQIQTSMLPRPKRVKFADSDRKLRS